MTFNDLEQLDRPQSIRFFIFFYFWYWFCSGSFYKLSLTHGQCYWWPERIFSKGNDVIGKCHTRFVHLGKKWSRVRLWNYVKYDLNVIHFLVQFTWFWITYTHTRNSVFVQNPYYGNTLIGRVDNFDVHLRGKGNRENFEELLMIEGKIAAQVGHTSPDRLSRSILYIADGSYW